MRCLPALFILFVGHLVVAEINDGNSSSEIPHEDSTEESEADDGIATLPDDEWYDEVIFTEDNEYEEIKLRNLSRYTPISRTMSVHDESDSPVSDEDEFERNETDSSPGSSPSEGRRRRKREDSCVNTYPSSFNCDPEYKYRTIDGSCNNLENPAWGMGMGCQERILKANYKGKTGFRQSVDGGPLPGPRTLSLDINTNESHPEILLNHLSMFFGQFFAHDMVLTPMFGTENGEVLPCCQKELREDPRCANIYAKKDDPFYAPLNHLCLDFPRSVTCSSCDENGRKLLNMNTAFLDASLVYGNSENRSTSLRTNDGTGKLISQNTSQGELLPNSSDPQYDQCSFPDKDMICFRAGDPRVNQHLIITCLQTIFMRQHNRIASKLKEINPSWDEDTLFQETRRIVGAMVQVIAFKEYLPIVLSPQSIKSYGLGLTPGFTKYDNSLNPSIWIEFSTAAFRVPHSSINTVVSTRARPVTEGYKWLRDLYSLPFGLRKGGFGGLMVDTTTTPAQMVDRFAVTDTNDYLYRIPGDPGGLDLSALDIQRGRDNGLPTYVQMVKFCHNVTIRNFVDPALLLFMDIPNIYVLKRNYKSVRDIDLETALQMERKVPRSIFGPTSTCVVQLQFQHLKYGDRFYFQHADQAGSFTEDQINELIKTSLTLILCKNVDGISALPKNAMLFAVPVLNEEVNCKDVKDLDFSKWKEESE